VLNLWGYSSQVSDSAEAALELLERRPSPILVTDLQMPGEGGLWLVRQVRQRWPEIGIIVMTGSHDVQAAVDCLNAGAHRYVFKPLNLEEFRHALETTLETFRLRQERARYQKRLEATVRRRTRQARATYLSAIDSLVLTLEARDPYTCGHSRRVRRYALMLGRAVGLEGPQLRRLGLAAKLHDIGKVGIPESVLHKAGDLTADEQRVAQTHPLIAEQILRPIIRSEQVLAAIRGHHERIDGLGYPDGLAGDGIPPLARMVSVADCFDALTSARPYRPVPPSHHEALSIIRESAGSQLDPTYVDAFLDAIHARPELVESQVA
jgi:putative two-component system response regulator